MKLFNSLAALAICALAAFAVTSCENDTSDEILPIAKSFTDALQQEFPNAKNVTWELNRQYKVAKFDEDFKTYDVWLDPAAKLKMTEIDYGKSFNLVPDTAVEKAFASTMYSDWALNNITSYSRDNGTFYVIEVEKTGHQDMDVYISEYGNLIKVANHTRDIITPSTHI
ncbi:MAG: PepSY-like domain-containing protein [Muribaculaceae bacterium]|nr:PepSY-like domain-containing protein [Muribaculaceae bacterium]